MPLLTRQRWGPLTDVTRVQLVAMRPKEVRCGQSSFCRTKIQFVATRLHQNSLFIFLPLFFLYFSPLRIDIIPHSFPFDPSDVDRSVSFYPTDCVRKSLPAFEPRKISFRIHKFRPRRTIRIYWWNLFPFWNPHLSPTWANIFY